MDVRRRWRETGNNILIGSLPKLSILYLGTDSIQCLREDICFPKHLVRYYIRFGPNCYPRQSLYPTTRELIVEKMDVAKLNAFKEIIPGVNSLSLSNIEDDCIPNIMPTVDQTGLHELTSLSLERCHSMKCLLDTTDSISRWPVQSKLHANLQEERPNTAFPKLESIHLNGMDSLTELICGLPPDGLFKELHELHLHGCNKLCTIIPAKLSRISPNLKEVSVQFCEEVKELFELDLVRTDTKENDLLLYNLESLGPTIEVVSLVKLTELQIYGCPKLASLLSLSLAQCLGQLQVLKISMCSELIQIFYADERQANDHEPTVWFSQLRVLELRELPKFVSFWHENYIPTCPLIPSLEELCVEGCPKMGTQFIAALRVFEKKLEVLEVEGPKWSGSCNTVLEQLMRGSRISLQKLSITNVEGLRSCIPGLVKVERDLTIRDCKGFEELLQVGGEHNVHCLRQSAISLIRLTLRELPDLTCIWRGPSQILIFHNLWSLYVSECHGLKTLLTTSIARSLLQLWRLEVKDCRELEQIFGDDETEKTTEIVTLPRFCSLYLIQLPNLISFCPSTYHFIFPCDSIYVGDCPNNRTGFSLGTDTERHLPVVHAKGEALCSTQNRGKCNDIHGTASLPLYKEDI